MKVYEYLNTIKSQENYVTHSLILKNQDIDGVVYKYLTKITEFTAVGKEIFIATEYEGEGLENREVILAIEVIPE